jgi:hypothetical protein
MLVERGTARAGRDSEGRFPAKFLNCAQPSPNPAQCHRPIPAAATAPGPDTTDRSDGRIPGGPLPPPPWLGQSLDPVPTTGAVGYRDSQLPPSAVPLATSPSGERQGWGRAHGVFPQPWNSRPASGRFVALSLTQPAGRGSHGFSAGWIALHRLIPTNTAKHGECQPPHSPDTHSPDDTPSSSSSTAKRQLLKIFSIAFPLASSSTSLSR